MENAHPVRLHKMGTSIRQDMKLVNPANKRKFRISSSEPALQAHRSSNTGEAGYNVWTPSAIRTAPAVPTVLQRRAESMPPKKLSE
jgi:glycine cleavage system aminomethyltransferase T